MCKLNLKLTAIYLPGRTHNEDNCSGTSSIIICILIANPSILLVDRVIRWWIGVEIGVDVGDSSSLGNSTRPYEPIVLRSCEHLAADPVLDLERVLICRYQVLHVGWHVIRQLLDYVYIFESLKVGAHLIQSLDDLCRGQ